MFFMSCVFAGRYDIPLIITSSTTMAEVAVCVLLLDEGDEVAELLHSLYHHWKTYNFAPHCATFAPRCTALHCAADDNDSDDVVLLNIC